MNKAQRQEAARQRPLMRQLTVGELREYERGNPMLRFHSSWRVDLRTKAMRREDDLIARAARRRRHQRRGSKDTRGTRCKQHQPGPAPMARGPYRPPRTPDVSHAPEARRYEGKSS